MDNELLRFARLAAAACRVAPAPSRFATPACAPAALLAVLLLRERLRLIYLGLEDLLRKRGFEAVLPARALNVLVQSGAGGFGLTLWIALTTTRRASGIAGSRF
jgi:hypothetical protein